MKPITFKQVLSTTGSLEALELWQGNNHIVLSYPVKALTGQDIVGLRSKK